MSNTKRARYFSRKLRAQEDGDEKSILEREAKPFGPMDSYDFNSLVRKVSLCLNLLKL